MTTSNGRSTEPRRSGRSVGQWLLGLLIVLAIVASILMVFTDQLSISGSLAVIAALWAAVIGAILVTKFRRQAESAEAKSRDLRLVYELQLEREIAARRQYELDVETTIRKEVSAESNEELAELKAQVLALRSSLETLLGESLPDPRVALPSEKLRELASGIGQPGGYGSGYGGGTGFGADFATDDSVRAAQDFATTAPAADSGRRIPADVDPNEMTEVIPVITDEAPISGRIATEVPNDVTDDQVQDAVLADEEAGAETSAPADAYVDESPTDEWPPAQSAAPVSAARESAAPESVDDLPADAGTDIPEAADEESAPAEPAPDNARPEPSPESASFAAMGRHEGSGDESNPALQGRRRRRGEDSESAHSAGLPVSELLSQLRQSGAPGGGRRRRED
ncbi:DUF6779 domain-containing protein [Gordonia sp. Z-3]|jgi:hypothetical protein|uniref:DUF6779 domain-containing protein n=1 Tax=Gordonia sp. Z-3 TaxID=3115408 RepID=UPI002E2C8572|nr:DUF6779 domain-containing protein [Gordonia sp. Z-3]MED5802623.1 DUF6779 domain-containing protein [Gordonia sp. Z-3]